MKFKHALQNQKGSALMEVLAAMGILLFVITGMMITISYARYKSISNYRYRIALLKAESELQIIKKKYPTLSFYQLASKEFFIQTEGNAKPIKAMITYRIENANDEQIRLFEQTKILKVTVSWQEPSPLLVFGSNQNRQKELTVREDYYLNKD